MKFDRDALAAVLVAVNSDPIKRDRNSRHRLNETQPNETQPISQHRVLVLVHFLAVVVVDCAGVFAVEMKLKRCLHLSENAVFLFAA